MLLSHQILRNQVWCKKVRRIKNKKRNEIAFFWSQASAIFRIHDIGTRWTHLTMSSMQSHVCALFSTFLSPSLSHLFLRHRAPLFLPSTSGLAQFAVPMHASLEDTRCSSYAHTRVYTPCTSQISTLREHTNKPRVYLLRPTCLYACFSLSSSLLSIPINSSLSLSPRRFRPL